MNNFLGNYNLNNHIQEEIRNVHGFIHVDNKIDSQISFKKPLVPDRFRVKF
jgi:hypothetical protein